MEEPPGDAAALFGPEAQLLLRLAAALGLGILLGIDRERTKDPETGFAGIRTFALITLAGALSALVGDAFALPWMLPVAFAVLGLLVIASYVVSALRGDVGMTTEITALIAFLVGVACERGELGVASAVTVAVMLVLVLKDWLHAVTRRLSTEDVSATVQLAIVSLIVLPLVPDRTFGPPPFDALNPYRIWLMVVLISGIDFVSWILVKVVGKEHGIGLTGLLGGLVSSTATTLSFAKQSRGGTSRAPELALGILLASLVMLLRIVVVLAVAGRSILVATWPGIAALVAANALAAAWTWRLARRGGDDRAGEREPTSRAKGRAGSDDDAGDADGGERDDRAGGNPFELSKAVRFALLFGVVSFLARGAELWLGSSGLYLAGAIAGLTDVDAITLSMSQLAGREPDHVTIAGRAVVLALVANTLVKGGITAIGGSRPLAKLVVPATLAIAAAGAAVAFVVR